MTKNSRSKAVNNLAAAGISFIKNYPQPVQIITENGWTVAVSDSFLEKFNLNESSILGEGTHSFFDDVMLQEAGITTAAQKALSGKKIELPAVVIRGSTDTFEEQAFKISFFRLDIQEQHCLGITYEDVSGYSAMHENINQKEKDIDSFIYTVSHDLKSPMNVILNCMELVFDPDIQENKEFVEKNKQMILRNIGFMQRFLNSILGYSRAGRELSAAHEPNMPASLIIRSVFSDIKSINPDVQAELKVGKLPDLSLHPDDAIQLFQNLVDNSFKYRDANRPLVIEVFAEKMAGHMVFAFKDNGIGMNLFDQKKIFDVFYRGSNIKDDPKMEGSGLGMSIVAKIVEKAGGKIWLKSEAKEGTTFFFNFSDS